MHKNKKMSAYSISAFIFFFTFSIFLSILTNSILYAIILIMKTKISILNRASLKKMVLGGGFLLFGGLPISQSYAQASTPASCFYFDETRGAITSYNPS